MINLRKDEKIGINLSKNSDELAKVMVGLGWKSPDSVLYKKFDIDVSCFGMSNGKVPQDEWMVCYGNLTSPGGLIKHSGDDLEGNDGSDDCEQVVIALEDIPDYIDEISIVATIHNAEKRGQDFSGALDAYMRLVDIGNDDEPIAMYKLNDNYTGFWGVQVGSFLREDGQWNFQAVGVGFKDTLLGIAKKLGVNAYD